MNNYNPRLLQITMDEGDVIRRQKHYIKELEAKVKTLEQKVKELEGELKSVYED